MTAFAILSGLFMDYEVFLVSGMWESYVTSVFSGFIFGDNASVKSVGFAPAFGVQSMGSWWA